MIGDALERWNPDHLLWFSNPLEPAGTRWNPLEQGARGPQLLTARVKLIGPRAALRPLR